MKTTKEMIEVMQAYEDGAEIEYRNWMGAMDDEWAQLDEPSWNWARSNYRVKPKPREI